MNNVVLIGRLTKDPVLRYTKSNTPVANFRLAVNRQSKDDDADFIDCVIWRQQAENLKKYIGKGSQVCVQGSIRTGTFEKDGQTRKKFTINAFSVEYLDTKQSDDNQQSQEETGYKDPKDMDEIDVAEDDLPF